MPGRGGKGMLSRHGESDSIREVVHSRWDCEGKN